MVKGYVQMPAPSETYELVQLLRLNGVRVERTRSGGFKITRASQFIWTPKELTVAEFKKQFGHGTVEYEVLCKHPRASTIIKSRPTKRSLA